MKNLLTQAGLTTAQADAYLLLLNDGALSPPQVAKKLKLTRSNAYKVLEQLTTLKLASREDKQKKLVFSASDPAALQDILAVERNKVLALEHAVKQSVDALTETYYKRISALDAKTYRGPEILKKLYEDQTLQQQPIYFLKSRFDIPTLGYDIMSYVRSLPAKLGIQRYGITPDSAEAPANPAIDKRSNLTRTWIDETAYTSPVEWSVSGDEVTIFVFEKDGSAVRIKNQTVADSFRQIWQLIDKQLRKDPNYAALPLKSNRNI